LRQAVEFERSIGCERIRKHCRPMAEAFYLGLRDIPGVEVLSPAQENFRSQMIGFRVRGMDQSKVVAMFAERKIRVRGVSEGGLNSVRVSFFLPNRMSEVDAALELLKKLAG
jgi:selenocysteine lyase/cysteine desulfurase